MIAEVAQRFRFLLLAKPFHLSELEGAVRSAIRASYETDPNGLQLGDDECSELKTRATAEG